MSYAPQELLELDRYLRSQGVPPVGIVGDSGHTYGYHLGKDRLRSGDYSAQHARDRAGLSDAASAFDVGNHGGLRKLTAWMVAEARAGRRPDTREIIGPGSDGRAYRWARENGWRAQRRAEGDSHEWHTHESYYRDSEHRDKVQYFRSYFEGDDDVNAQDVWTYDPNDPKKGGIQNPAYRADAKSNPTVQPSFAIESIWGDTHEINERSKAILAAATGASAEEIEGAIREEGEKTRAALAAKLAELAPSLAQAVADKVDHDLDTAAAAEALREVFGGIDNPPAG